MNATTTTTFLDYAHVVMTRREQSGAIRGIGREKSRFRCHVLTAPFVERPLAQIRPREIREWLRVMAEKKCADKRGLRNLDRATTSRSLSLVSTIFAEAARDDLIEHNPCDRVKPEKRVDESSTKEKWVYLTIEEQRTIAACEAIPYAARLAIRFAFATGLRQGEQFNLEIRDVHVAGAEPHVYVRFGSKGRPPKSGKPRRVPLFGDGLRCVEEQLAFLSAANTVNTVNTDGLLFPSPTGRRRHQGKPLGRSDMFHRYLDAAGVRRARWHDARHSAASNLITGVLGRRWSLDEVRVFLGHSSVVVTQRYAHLGEDALQRAARETTMPTAAVAPLAPVVVIGQIPEIVDRDYPPGQPDAAARTEAAAVAAVASEKRRTAGDAAWSALGGFMGFLRKAAGR